MTIPVIITNKEIITLPINNVLFSSSPVCIFIGLLSNSNSHTTSFSSNNSPSTKVPLSLISILTTLSDR